MTADERRALLEAMRVLQNGSPRRFDDLLWLGFGDAWWPLRVRLIKSKYVRLRPGHLQEPQITERGERLIQQLSRETVPAQQRSA